MNRQAHIASQPLTQQLASQQLTTLRSVDLNQLQPVSRLKYMDSAPRQRCKQCALHGVCLSQSASNDSLEALSAMAKHSKPVQKGSHFYRQHDKFGSLYIVRSGAVKTYYINEKGEQYITGYYLPGEWFGIDGLVSRQHKYAAQALDTSTVCEIAYSKLEQGFQSHPELHSELHLELQRRIMEALCTEIYDRQQPLLSLRQNSVEQRLATFLTDISSRLTRRGLSATEFNLPMARRDIAAYLGVAEETMSRLFSRFQSKKLLSVTGRLISINDLNALKAMSVTLN